MSESERQIIIGQQAQYIQTLKWQIMSLEKELAVAKGKAKRHNRRGKRWEYLTSLKKPDAIGLAFAMLEESVLHHEIERDGWTPDDTCYMETTQEARKLIEDYYATKQEE